LPIHASFPKTRILSEEWMLIGRQENTGHGRRIDLVALAPDASLVLIELKRGKTPREVVAQALDYAAWIEKLQAEDITGIYNRFAPREASWMIIVVVFGQELDEDALNQSQIIIVASALDDRTEPLLQELCFGLVAQRQDCPVNGANGYPIRREAKAAMIPD
jgi:hypothetical protein